MSKKVKLSPKAASFSDPVSGLSLVPNEEKDLPIGNFWMIKAAIKGGHLIVIESPVEEPPVEPPVEPSVGEKLTAELLAMTRAEIMEEYDFIDDEHLAIANKKSDKPKLVEYLLSIVGEYQD